MAPEQLKDAAQVERRADVHALAAILFMIFVLEHLLAGDRAADLAAATLASTEARVRAAARSRDIPPELEDACVRATALDVESRTPTADDLVRAVERFLEGDRDLENRAKMASSEAQRAIELMTAPENLCAAREKALEHAGRALARARRPDG